MEIRPVGSSAEPAQRDATLSLMGLEAKMQKSGMTFPQNLSERSWEKIGISLRELTNSSAWWLADWLIFGEAAYGWRRYQEAIERTGLDYQTLRNYAWVARRFEHHRRRDGLSFAHHAEVTRLSTPEQDYWLRKAEQQNWSRNELRRAIRASLAEQSQEDELPEQGGDERRAAPRPIRSTSAGRRRQQATTLTIELSAGQLDSYSKVAAAHGLPVGKWVTQVLDAADRYAS
ncbi:LmbU family transcriptional regulator [Frankia sp. AvcI1]|uniref:LmbU family transcriptional regulator n=1 Tax=Frankia sp. AvcI1 TaxID=573496 RepID=UPI001F34DBA9|nr:LmbU family transcriptional regulator [Frankia sp. AvcI1]